MCALQLVEFRVQQDFKRVSFFFKAECISIRVKFYLLVFLICPLLAFLVLFVLFVVIWLLVVRVYFLTEEDPVSLSIHVGLHEVEDLNTNVDTR